MAHTDYVVRSPYLAEVRSGLEMRLSNKRAEMYQMRANGEPITLRLSSQYREIAALRRRINILDDAIGRQ